MNKRKLIVGGLGALIFVGAIFLRNYLDGMENLPPKNKNNGAAVVRTMTVLNDTQEVMLEVTGRIQAAERVDLFLVGRFSIPDK
jgi:multidrug efflux pump subunit AcrA (membrane-fusion protein)